MYYSNKAAAAVLLMGVAVLGGWLFYGMEILDWVGFDRMIKQSWR